MNTTTPSNRIPRRWFQFSLRTLLIGMTLIGALCGWFMIKWREAKTQQAMVEAIGLQSGNVEYDYQRDASGKLIPNSEPNAPKWLRDLLGDDFFCNAVVMRSLTTESDAQLQQHLRALPHLTALNIQSPHLTEACLLDIAQLSELKTLELPIMEVSDTGLRNLAGMIQLENLHFSSESFTNAGLNHLRGLTRLKSLGLHHSQITDAGLEVLKNMPQLEFLECSDTKLACNDLSPLLRLTKLKDLRLNRLTCGDECIKNTISHLPSLERLELENTKITDASLQLLADLPHLQDLYIDNTNITDVGLKHLADKLQLQRLSVTGTHITDDGLRYLLAKMPTLAWIHVYNTGTTRDTIEELIAKYPNCVIEFRLIY